MTWPESSATWRARSPSTTGSLTSLTERGEGALGFGWRGLRGAARFLVAVAFFFSGMARDPTRSDAGGAAPPPALPPRSGGDVRARLWCQRDGLGAEDERETRARGRPRGARP